MVYGKIATFIFQAVLVILAVLVFSYFDPFNIFNSKKLSMKDTPVIVNSIRSIGKLITSEYYGEVIGASGDALEDSVESMENKDKGRMLNAEKRAREAVSDISHEEDSLRKNRIKSKPKRLLKIFEKEYKNISDDQDYKALMDFAKKVYKVSEQDLLFFYYKNEGDELRDYKPELKRNFDSELTAFVKEKYKTTRREDRRIANHSLVILGRGWVKAGIDLSNFDDKHLNYLPDRNLVRLLYTAPEIISYTINPWFVPEKKIKGFEYLFIGSKIDNGKEASLQTVQNIKGQCLNKLLNDALDAGIMDKAKQEAELSLGHFLSLLLGKDTKVEIFSDPLDAFSEDLFSGDSITRRDLCSVDSLVSLHCKENPEGTYQFLKAIHDTLKAQGKKFFPWSDAAQNWGVMSCYFKIAEDDFLTSAEKDFVRKFRKDSTAGLKDYLYYAMEDSLMHEKLSDAGYVLRSMSPQDSLTVQGAKSNSLNRLDQYSKMLRGFLNAKELSRCDSTVAALLKKGNFKAACTYAQNAEAYMQVAEPWKGARQNWQVFAMYKFVEQKGYTPHVLDSMLARVPEKPAGKDYFYYLFYAQGICNNPRGKALFEALTAQQKDSTSVSALEAKKLKEKISALHSLNRKNLVSYGSKLPQR